MVADRIVFFRSKDGGPWERCDVSPKSIVGRMAAQGAPGMVAFDDGYGNRYKWEYDDAGL